jgi:RNA polymerase sigma-70 factor, ECF subfamily
VTLHDHYLVWRLRRNDRDACRDLIDRTHGMVFGYLRNLGADRALAEDLTQETYAKAWRQIGTLREAGSLRAWLMTIARNELLQVRRARVPQGDPLDPADEPPDRDRPTPDPMLRRAVAGLEDTLRETIALHYFHGLSLREIGAVAGVPAGTIKSRLNRALGRLREMIEEDQGHERQRAGA